MKTYGVVILNPSDSQGNQIADFRGVYPTLRGCGGAGYQQGYVLAPKGKPITLAEKRFFHWVEDDVSVTLRNCSGSYGGGSEVLIVCPHGNYSSGCKNPSVTR